MLNKFVMPIIKSNLSQATGFYSEIRFLVYEFMNGAGKSLKDIWYVISLALVVFYSTGLAAPPNPPPGFRWEVNEAFSDEFDGVELDASKWHDHNPDWIGRPPGKFMPSSVSVEDGFLKIQMTPLDPPQGDFSIAAGAIQSKSKDALYGYYECRMKASQLTASSNIWMVGDGLEIPGGKLGFELIVQFTIGGSAEHKDHMKSNAMVAYKPEGKDTKKEKAKLTDRVRLRSGVAEEFHTYGCWWVDANTIRFYVDGKYAYTIKPSTKFDDHPYRHPLSFNLVCETFDWQSLPTHSELTNPELNTTYFDYVRSYRLVED